MKTIQQIIRESKSNDFIITEQQTTSMPEEVYQLLNAQINNEFYAYYVYFSLSNEMNIIGLFGMAKWLKKSADDELKHVEKITKYLIDRGKKIDLKPIGAPQKGINTAIKAFEIANEQEMKVTADWKKIYKIAMEKNDSQTVILANWFIEEQTEEEQKTSDILLRLKLIGNSKGGLLALDREMGDDE